MIKLVRVMSGGNKSAEMVTISHVQRMNNKMNM